MAHAPLRRLLSLSRSGRGGRRAGETDEAANRRDPLHDHDQLDLGRAVAADREAIETKLGRRKP